MNGKQSSHFLFGNVMIVMHNGGRQKVIIWLKEEKVMQVIYIKDQHISVDELCERLENKEGILVWVDGTKNLKLIKSSYEVDKNKRYNYGWETLFFNRNLDCLEMEIYTLKQLIHFIKEILTKALGTIFWFPNEEEFIDWLVKEYKYILDRS